MAPRSSVAAALTNPVVTCLAGALLLLILTDTPSRAQSTLEAERFVLEDLIAVEIIDREVVAFDLQGSGRLALRLELDEEVLFYGSRGRVAVVLTNQRMLGATPVSA